MPMTNELFLAMIAARMTAYEVPSLTVIDTSKLRLSYGTLGISTSTTPAKGYVEMYDGLVIRWHSLTGITWVAYDPEGKPPPRLS